MARCFSAHEVACLSFAFRSLAIRVAHESCRALRFWSCGHRGVKLARHASCAVESMASERRTHGKSRSTSAHQRAVLRRRARENRYAPTASEQALWLAIRGGQLGVVFRRQVVLQGYIADFYACSVKLVVEVDGSWHYGRPGADARRERLLTRAGYHVLHVSAAEVLGTLPAVVMRIRAAIGALR